MTLTGVFINSITVFIAGMLGALIKREISDKLKTSLMVGLGLCVLYIGISGFSSDTNVIVLIISIVIGVFIGEIIDIDKRLYQFGNYMQRKLPFKDDNVADGFVASTLFVCVGAMSIVGGIESGTQGTYDTFLAKSFIDGLVIFILAASKGIGCSFSAFVALTYRLTITLSSGYIAKYISESVISQMSEVGSLLIVGVALNLLNITHIKIGNFILAPYIPVVLFLGQEIFAKVFA